MVTDGVSEGLTATEVAARLGVKRQTVYAYVSRGLLARQVASDGRTSMFDPADVDRLRGGRRDEGEVNTLIATGITRVDDRTLRIRGEDLIGRLHGGLGFEAAVELLWATPDGEAAAVADEGWPTTGIGTGVAGFGPLEAGGPEEAGLLDGLRITTALCSAADPLRHELSPRSVRAVGRRLITALANGLPPTTGTVSERPSPNDVATVVWSRLAAAPATTTAARAPEAGRRRIRAVEVALALLVDHGLAGSTFAARIAASVRADPYAVVGAGLGALGGRLHGAAGAAVHDLLVDGERRGDTAAALGQARRRLGYLPGVGHSVYTEQDPRYGALMATLVDAWGDDPRLVNVYRLRDLIGERTDAIPNIDLALGSLTYLAGMPSGGGEAVFAIARTAGWLAHAMEEYEEKPLRFRARAKYTGP
ncbi:MAG: citrate synthase [Actinomycetota bacterium]